MRKCKIVAAIMQNTPPFRAEATKFHVFIDELGIIATQKL